MSQSDHDRVLTWAGLLGKWTEFAQSAIALPDEGEGGRLKRAVPDIIGLQAIAQALAEIDELPPEERALGVDRAEIGIREHIGSIHTLWIGEPLHEGVAELIDDASAALLAATEGGLEWTVNGDRLIVTHPGHLLEALAAVGFEGDLFLPTPGVPVFDGAPCAFCRGRGGEIPDEAVLEMIDAYLCETGADVAPPQRLPEARQVYRQFDFSKGGPVRDLVIPMSHDLPPGQPLLVPAVLQGRPQPVTLPIAGADKQGPLPVVFSPDDGE